MMTAIRKRPVLLTVVCILGYIWIVFMLPIVFSPSIKKIGDWFPALFGLITACNFISFVGVWHMKKWGVQLHITVFFIRQITIVLLDDFGIFAGIGIMFSIFFITSMMIFYKGMDDNL